MNNIHLNKTRTVRQPIHHRNGRNRWNKTITKLCEPHLNGMKTYTGRRDIAPIILNFGNKVRFVLDINPGHCKEKGPHYSLNRRLGRPWSPSGCSKRTENFLPLPGFKPQSTRAVPMPLY
jgi:hypothetical protein